MDLINFKSLHYMDNTNQKSTKKATNQVRILGITICIPQNLIFKYVESHKCIISLLHKILRHHAFKNLVKLLNKIMNNKRTFQN